MGMNPEMAPALPRNDFSGVTSADAERSLQEVGCLLRDDVVITLLRHDGKTYALGIDLQLCRGSESKMIRALMRSTLTTMVTQDIISERQATEL